MFTHPVLVPFDFREESSHALSHAAAFAEIGGREIVLLHFVSTAEDTAAATPVMQSWKERFSEIYSGPLRTLVEVGDVMSDTGRVARDMGCGLIVMPTHGMVGNQVFSGSHALNVVTQSQMPFVVVQQKSVGAQGYKRMVIQADLRSELLDAMDHFIDIARHFHSEVHLVVNTRQADIREKIDLEEITLKLRNAEIPIVISESSKFDFTKAVTEYAQSVNADLICAVNYAYENLFGLYPSTDEEDLIYNAGQIPVMLVTPVEAGDEGLMRPLEEM
jgi:nucleotide-binding universal stress UspA family protein